MHVTYGASETHTVIAEGDVDIFVLESLDKDGQVDHCGCLVKVVPASSARGVSTRVMRETGMIAPWTRLCVGHADGFHRVGLGGFVPSPH